MEHFGAMFFNPEQKLSYFLGTWGIFLAAFFTGRWALKSAFTTVELSVHIDAGTDLTKLRNEMEEELKRKSGEK